MKHTLRGLLVLLLLANAGEALSQNVITFDNTDRRGPTRNRRRNDDVARNSLTVGLLSWFNGYTPLYYERGLSDVLSLQLGIGVTSRSFGADLGSILSSDGETSDNFRGTDQDIVDEYAEYKYRKTSPGLYASFAPKIYYQAEGMDGAYVSPMIEYKQYRFNARKADGSETASGYYTSDAEVPRSTLSQEEYMRCIDLTVNFGGHWQTGNHLVFGFSTGLGVRTASAQRLDLGMRAVPNGLGAGSYDYRYANAVNTFDKTTLIFTFNFTIGGCF